MSDLATITAIPRKKVKRVKKPSKVIRRLREAAMEALMLWELEKMRCDIIAALEAIIMTDLAIVTAILYGARLQRRVPESDGEKHRTIDEAVADAKLIMEAVRLATTPEQPPPSPGTIGRIADAKATRRRG